MSQVECPKCNQSNTRFTRYEEGTSEFTCEDCGHVFYIGLGGIEEEVEEDEDNIDPEIEEGLFSEDDKDALP